MDMFIKTGNLIKGGILFLCTAALTSVPADLKADEAALYDTAPEGSAFLRVINLQNSPLNHKIAGKYLGRVGYCDATSFIYLPAGEYQKQEVNGLSWNGLLQANKAYSLVVSDTSVALLSEPRASHARKAVLSVYNFSNYAYLSVMTKTGTHSVFKNITQGKSAYRDINPLKISFAIFDQQQRVLDTESVIFQAGELSSLFLCSGNTELLSRWNG